MEITADFKSKAYSSHAAFIIYKQKMQHLPRCLIAESKGSNIKYAMGFFFYLSKKLSILKWGSPGLWGN